jgi:hypothetical protein
MTRPAEHQVFPAHYQITNPCRLTGKKKVVHCTTLKKFQMNQSDCFTILIRTVSRPCVNWAK